MSQDGNKDKDDKAPLIEKTEEEKKAEEDKKSGGLPKVALPKIKNPMDEEPYESEAHTEPDIYTLSPCCCCLCACSHDRVGDASCLGCFPIRCGVVFIGAFVFLLCVILLTTTFFGLLNEYIPWWFTFVTMLLLIPLAIGASMTVYFFAKDKRSTRGKLRGALILSIISVFLWAVW